MDSFEHAMLEQIYTDATILSRKNSQVVGEKRNFYITLEQLEAILKRIED